MITNNSYYSSGKFTQRSKTVYGQASGLPSENVLCAEYDSCGTLWVGTDNGLAYFNADKFVPVALNKDGEEQAAAFLCKDADGSVITAVGNTLYSCKKNKVKKGQAIDGEVMDFALCGDKAYIVTRENLYKRENGEWVFDMEIDGSNGKKVAVFGDSICVLTDNALLIMAGKRRHWKGILPIFSGMPACTVNDIVFDEVGYLWVATDEGLRLYDCNNYWVDSSILSALPKESIYTIKADLKGNRYMASDCGVIYQQGGLFKYFEAERWAPVNKINDVAVTDDGAIFWAATEKGISRIDSCMMSLKDKADHYQETVEKYHVRDMGFVTVAHGIKDDDWSNSEVEISDNDGLWTEYYLASQAYRYAVTGDKQALEIARRCVKAMFYLMDQTGKPGFTARAIRREGEEGFGNGHHEWTTSVDGTCEWRGETSSDEMTGHFYGMSLFYDLCANDEEKEQVKQHLCAIVDHIIENNLRLCDLDGKPTTWANWNPMDLNHSDKWVWESGVNSLEIMAFLKVVYHMSGDEKYNELYNELVSRHHYAINIAHHKVHDAHVTHIDDDLAFLAMPMLLRYEKNEGIRRLALMGITHHWNYERIERTPFWNLIYGAYTGLYCDIEAAVQSLREMPLSLVRYKIDNSKRRSLVYDDEQEAWGEPAQLKEPLPYDERPLCKYDANPFKPCGGDSTSAEDGTMYLLPYWFARYHKLIVENDD